MQRAADAHRNAGLPVFAAAQFFLSLSWVAYAIFLPGLAAQVGLPKSAVVWLLLADQIVFIGADALTGILSDRVGGAMHRWGRMLGLATGVAALALLALPVLTRAVASPAALVLPALVWIVGSAALRAPLFALLGRRAQATTGEGYRWLLLGNGVALAAAPYLGSVLKGASPLLPFVLISAGLLLCGLLVWQSVAQEAPQAAGSAKAQATLPQAPVFFPALLLATLAFQIHTAFNAGPLYARVVPAAELHWWTPTFWVGFNLALIAPPVLADWPAARRLSAFAMLGMAALLACTGALQPWLQAPLQAIAGAAWAWFICGAFATANALGAPSRRGAMAGGVHATLAGGSALRLSMAAAALPQSFGPGLLVVPAMLFALAALLLWLAPRVETAPKPI